MGNAFRANRDKPVAGTVAGLRSPMADVTTTLRRLCLAMKLPWGMSGKNVLDAVFFELFDNLPAPGPQAVSAVAFGNALQERWMVRQDHRLAEFPGCRFGEFQLQPAEVARGLLLRQFRAINNELLMAMNRQLPDTNV